ncbi:MAG: putative lipid II flippase FtsW [Lachnospiraceae bacterium]|nr:putative lipid II flippase FtsW [Lachnospiraceae bacterium]
MEQGKRRKKKRYYDYTLLFLVLFLVCFGMVMVYSVSYYNANKYYNDPTLFLRKQAIFGVAGTVLMIFISKIDYRIYVKKLPILPMKPIFFLYLVCILLQLYLVLFGDSTGGSQRWIELGSFGKFQPSEISKICVLLLTAYLVKLAPQRLNSIKGFIRILLIMAPLIALVVWENFSTALVMGVMLVAICFVASRKKSYYIVIALLLVAVGVVFIVRFPYRLERIEVWRDIENHPKGYQILQGLYAIASGGLFGKGLGQGVQKLGYIPEAHNDMIFSTICEELGMVGAFAVLFLFVLLLWRIFIIAINAPDLFGSLIATGVLAHIAVQVLINVSVVTNTIPSTGIPLPFISYGGSSLLVLMMEMGIVLNVSDRIEEV